MNKIVWLDEIDSTNSYVEKNVSLMQHGDVVAARAQTSGRGQRGNGWEAEPGKNLTFTMLLHPKIAPIDQFSLSCVVALAVCDILREYCGVECKVKWPNDIYTADNKKICGILISHALMGRNISHSIVGVGININQEKFHSDAPNPVSVFQLTGKTHNCESLLASLSERIIEESDRLISSDYRGIVHRRYMQNLWRGDKNIYPFKETSSGEYFEARVEGIETTGHLLLRDTSDTLRRFAFKEVEWLL